MAAEGLRGRLLAATPGLLDPNFHRSVVLLLEHTAEGAVGVVLNRPGEAALAETLPEWLQLAVHPHVVFLGGPVQPQAAIALGRSAGTAATEGWTAISGPVGVIDLRQPPGDVPVDAVRLFAGYAGWGPGQLDEEVAQGSWFVVEGGPDDAFCTDPGGLWLQVVRRQGGLYARFPADPTTN